MGLAWTGTSGGSTGEGAARREITATDRTSSVTSPTLQRQFDREPAMPLIPFDIPHGHGPTEPGKFSNRFSEHPLPTPRRPETRYVSSAYGHPDPERDLS
jgi:hypothetical protein